MLTSKISKQIFKDTHFDTLKYLGNINCEVLSLAKLGKPCLPQNF